MLTKPKFEYVELHTPAMARLREHLEAKQESLRRLNDRPQPEMDTAFLRGQIKNLKDTLTLLGAEPAKATDAAE